MFKNSNGLDISELFIIIKKTNTFIYLKYISSSYVSVFVVEK